MYAMQYELTLPADYDMEIIRKRVRNGGHRTDGFPGLGIKAYLIRERGVDGSPVNQYAPFYLWRDIGGMNEFLWGGGWFTRIVEDFGRPPVRHWTGVDFRPGSANGASPTYATRETTPLALGVDPAEPIRDARDKVRARALLDNVHSIVLAVDPQQWELVEFTLWTKIPSKRAGLPYTVLHLSSGSA